MWLQDVAGLPGHGKWWAETRAVFQADLLSTMPGEIVFSCDNSRKVWYCAYSREPQYRTTCIINYNPHDGGPQKGTPNYGKLSIFPRECYQTPRLCNKLVIIERRGMVLNA